MKRNMKQWLKDYKDAPVKKAMPILSFPGAVMMNRTVNELVRDGHLQALCMKTIADRFDTGAAFSLMDLSVEAEAFGSPVLYSDEDVPTVNGVLIHEEEEAQALKVPKVGDGRTGACVEGIKEASQLITDRPVLAGIIGPFSLAGRLTDMTEIMYLCFDEPEMVECLLEKATEFLIQYALAFKEAGANGVCMAEPAAGLLSPQLFEEFSVPYVQKIRSAVEDENFIVMYHNCGNIKPLLPAVKEIGACAYSVGNSIDIEDALKVLPEDAMVIGNIDPAGVIRSGTPELIYQETLQLLERCSRYGNFVLASGCDIPPMSPVENIQALFDAVQEFYKDKA
ncbi:MAG: uroporphyrinogen decarboxylase family protein [Lachnospiraceae bacterium]|nr:uroporphyrinogen decarboxylase family protein [Lachnospiraceae bacterium]